MKDIALYTKTSPLKLFFLVAVPGGISMLASSLWGVFEGVYVGQLLGEVAFAAVNLSYSIIFINFALADLIGVGSSVRMAIYLGQKQPDKASNYFTCACLLIIFVGIINGLVLYVTAPQLLIFLGASGELAEQAITYIRVYAICSPFASMAFAVDNFLRICGQVKSSMALNILLSLLIVLMEFICLAVLELGIGGSSFAVSFCLFICTLLGLLPFFLGRLPLRFCRPHWEWSIIRHIFCSGAPTFINNISSRVITVILNIILLRIGGIDAVNIFGILLYVSDFFQQIMYGVCDSLQPAIGYNWGAKKLHRVIGIAKCCIGATAAVSLIAISSMLLFPQQVISLFIKEDLAAISLMAIPALQLFSLTYLTKWLNFAAESLFAAINKPLPATILSVSYTFFLPLLLMAVMYPLELEEIWLIFPVTSAIVSLMAISFYMYLRHGLTAANAELLQ